MSRNNAILLAGGILFLLGQGLVLLQQPAWGGGLSGIAVLGVLFYRLPALQRPKAFFGLAAVLVILAQWVIPESPSGGMMLFLVAGIFLLLSHPVRLGDGWGELPQAPAPRLAWEPWFLVALTGLSLGLRFYRLSSLPLGAAQQEGDFLDYYLMYFERGPYLAQIPAPEGMPFSSLGLFQGVWFAKWLGWNVSHFRIPSILYSLSAILGFYFLVRRLTSPLTAAVTSVMFSASYFHLILSRTFFIYPLLFLPFTLGLGLLLTGLRRPRIQYFLLSGMAMGFGIHSYYPGRGVALIFSAWILWLALWYRPRLPAVKYWGWLAAGFLLISAPILHYYFSNWDASWQYVRAFNAVRGQGLGTTLGYVWQMLPTALGIFQVKTHVAAQFHLPYKPLLDFFSGTFFALGLVICLVIFWRPMPMFFFLAFFASLMPAILGTPFYARRACMTIPMVYLFAAYAFERLRLAGGSLWPKQGKYWLAGAGVLVSLVSVAQNSWDYFVRFANQPATLRAYFHQNYLAGKEMEAHPSAQWVLQPLFMHQYTPWSILFPYQPKLQIPHALEELLVTEPGQDRLLLLEPYAQTLIPFFQKEFPHAQVKVFREDREIPDARTMENFYTLFMDASNPGLFLVRILIPEGDLRAFADFLEITPGQASSRVQAFAGTFAQAHAGQAMRLAGAILAPEGGSVVFDLKWQGWELTLDRRPLAWRQSVVLAPGIHYLEMRGRVPDNAQGALPWQGLDNGRDLRLQGRLVALQQGMGARIDYVHGKGEWNGRALITAQDLFPVKRFYASPENGRLRLPGPVSIRWLAWLNVPEPGGYRFRVNKATPCRILIQGAEVFCSLEDPESPRSLPVTLKPGEPVPVRVEMNLGSELNNNTILLEYLGPGKNGFAPVPLEWIRLDAR